jgi:DNA-binding CsgD family transcriptional regulator/PAS domain-containing protein
MTSMDAFASLVEEIYEAGIDAQRWPEMLDQLVAASGTRIAGLKIVARGRADFILASTGADPTAVGLYNEHYHRIDPIAAAVQSKPVGALFTDRQIIPKAQLRRTEFYNEWVRPQDYGDCAMVKLFRDTTRSGILCIAAPERLEAVGLQSLQLLQHLTPHLQRAARVTLKLADLESLRSAGLEALDSLSEGVVLVDANARVVFANRAAEAMFARADGIGIDRIGLCAASATHTTALRRLIAVSARPGEVAEPGGSLLLDRPSGRRPLSVIVAPMRREAPWSLVAPPLTIVFVADPERDAEMPGSRLRALYGVTPTEATVARLISKGSGVKGAARLLGIAPSTARTHLHRVFEKTGTTRQAELAHLVNRIASVSGTDSK